MAVRPGAPSADGNGMFAATELAADGGALHSPCSSPLRVPRWLLSSWSVDYRHRRMRTARGRRLLRASLLALDRRGRVACRCDVAAASSLALTGACGAACPCRAPRGRTSAAFATGAAGSQPYRAPRTCAAAPPGSADVRRRTLLRCRSRTRAPSRLLRLCAQPRAFPGCLGRRVAAAATARFAFSSGSPRRLPLAARGPGAPGVDAAGFDAHRPSSHRSIEIAWAASPRAFRSRWPFARKCSEPLASRWRVRCVGGRIPRWLDAPCAAASRIEVEFGRLRRSRGSSSARDWPRSVRARLGSTSTHTTSRLHPTAGSSQRLRKVRVRRRLRCNGTRCSWTWRTRTRRRTYGRGPRWCTCCIGPRGPSGGRCANASGGGAGRLDGVDGRIESARAAGTGDSPARRCAGGSNDSGGGGGGEELLVDSR